VQVGVLEWNEVLYHFCEFSEVWIQLEGIPPKWCDWKVFAQTASGFGLLLEVGWASLFKSFYERVRVKVACKNPRMIPHERLYEPDKLFLNSIVVEGFEDSNEDNLGGDDDGDGPGGGDGGTNDDEADDLDDESDQMETNKKSTAGANIKTPISRQTCHNSGSAKTISVNQDMEIP
jgi:hypothetical protein